MQLVSTCPACGSDSSRIRADDGPEIRRRFRGFSAKKYGGVMDPWLAEIKLRVRQCTGCGHCWYEQQPEKEQLFEMYAASIPLYPERHGDRRSTVAMSAEMRRLRRLAAPTPDDGTKPRLLDYGSGYGRWARAAIAAGFDVLAFEPSIARGRDEQAETDGFRVVHRVEELAGQTFDAVNLEQVLEHIPDPAAAMATIRGLCRDGTVVRITVPNIERPYEGRAIWDTWPWDGARTHTLAPFEHLHGFTPRSLAALLRRHGFVSLAPSRLLGTDPILLGRQMAGFLIGHLAPTKALARLA